MRQKEFVRQLFTVPHKQFAVRSHSTNDAIEQRTTTVAVVQADFDVLLGGKAGGLDIRYPFGHQLIATRVFDKIKLQGTIG